MKELGRYILRRIATAIALITMVICFTFFVFKLPTILWGASPASLYIIDVLLPPCLRPPPQLDSYWVIEFGLVRTPDVFDWIYMFGKFIAKSFTGQYGFSLRTQECVSLELMERLPNTLLLMISTIIISTIYMKLRNDQNIGILNYKSKILAMNNKILSITILTEITFKINGIGNWFFSSLLSGDYPVMQACFIVLSVIVITITLVSDIVTKYLDQKQSHCVYESVKREGKGLPPPR